MSKAVMISIQPKWCEFIASGKKTMEVRKTRPQLQTPFKCYIYCTSKKIKAEPMNTNGMIRVKIKPPKHASIKLIANSYPWFQKVVGEFVCDRIDRLYIPMSTSATPPDREDVEKATCLSLGELKKYANGEMFLYGWHISDLKIYDKPKELGEFSVECKAGYRKCNACTALGFNRDNCILSGGKFIKPLKQAPQSWFYVEEV